MKKALGAVLVLIACATAQILLPIAGNSPASNPTPPTSGMQVWYRSDSLVCTLGCTGTDLVTQWTDKSSNANNATSVTAGTYVASALNGLPGVLFNGTSTAYSFTAVNLQTASTIFTVAKLTSASSANNSIIAGSTGSVQYSLGISSKEQTFTKTSTVQLGQGSAASDTSYHQINVTYNATTLSFRLGEASDGSSSVSTAITANDTSLGWNASNSSNFLNGTLLEVIVYNRVLSGGEITTVESYLNNRYGI